MTISVAFIKCLNELFSLIIFAGTPPTVTEAGTSFVTTAFAPITELSPIEICPIIFAPGPIYTLSPIIAASNSPPFAPIFTPACILQFSPMKAFDEITIVQ